MSKTASDQIDLEDSNETSEDLDDEVVHSSHHHKHLVECLLLLELCLISSAFTTRVLKLAPKVFLFLLLPQPATCKKYMKLNITN